MKIGELISKLSQFGDEKEIRLGVCWSMNGIILDEFDKIHLDQDQNGNVYFDITEFIGD